MNMPIAGRSKPALPPLQNGDRMRRDEFERRYDAMPGLKKAELIRGVVYVPSPVNHDSHGRPHAQVMLWLGYYSAMTPGTDVGDNSTVRLDEENEPQPDASLLLLPDWGGQVRFDEKRYINNAPELVVEVSASSASYDLHDKLSVYAENQVREYVVWRVFDEAVDWFIGDGVAFRPTAPNADGIYESAVFPGLWLDAPALVRGDARRVLEVVQQGLASAEHQAFVQALQRHKEHGS